MLGAVLTGAIEISYPASATLYTHTHTYTRRHVRARVKSKNRGGGRERNTGYPSTTRWSFRRGPKEELDLQQESCNVS